MAAKADAQPAITRKIHPKLRMIANGDERVNILRAEHCAALALRPMAKPAEVLLMRGDDSVPLTKERVQKAPPIRKLTSPAADLAVNVFIDIDDTEKSPDKFGGETARKGNIATAELPLNEIVTTAGEDRVAYLSLGDALTAPTPTVHAEAVAPPEESVRRIALAEQHRDGAGVLIGIIDVQGFDFAHPDFLDDDGKTRFLEIWDQGGTERPDPKAANAGRYDYGSLLTEEHLNTAIAAAPELGVLPQDLEPQSQMVIGSHGTHVASIAGGNVGICRQARLAAVLIALSQEDLDRRRSLYDSTRIAHAVDHLFELGDKLGMPVSINVSLGTNGHAHDASSAISRWIDSALAIPGRSLCVAAGNAGQEAPEFEGDIGFVMGRIHTSGRIPAQGLDVDVVWNVVGNGIADLSENELEIWYEPQDRFRVSVRPPNGPWIGPVDPGEYIENRQLDDLSFISIYNELYHPANGNNYISIYLSPLLSDSAIVGVTAGAWTVRLHGLDIRDGRYHGWIERDDPRRIGRIGPRQAWRFPSFFAEGSNVDNSSVSSLACGRRVISVANLDAAALRINSSSSQGPTRDGRPKPEVAAPGTEIVAAKGFGPPSDAWVAMTGTSMASPYVAGVAGLMLATDRSLTAAQIGGIIQRTARPLPGTDYVWRNDAGFGVVSAEDCVAEAAIANSRKDLTS